MHDLHGRTVTVEDISHKLNIDSKEAQVLDAAPDLLKHLKRLVGRSDNGDIIEPGWYEIEDARAAIEQAEQS